MSKEFTIPHWLIARSDMRDEQKWRYTLLCYHCEQQGGLYQGNGEAFSRDFGIGRYAVDTALAPFVERGLIVVSVTGAMNCATMIDTRLWSVRLVEQGSNRYSPGQ